MDLNADAPQGGEQPTFVHQPAGNGELSIADAARSWADARYKAQAALNDDQEQPAEPPAQAEPPKESAQADAAPPQEATSETQANDPAEELPPLELPRSWTKEQAEHWNALPRTVQEYLTEKASKDSDAVRRSQNEAAEKSKAYEAKLSEAEKARNDYEAKLPALMQMLQARGDFADIRTLDDVKKLQAEDPFRFQAWQLHQMELQAVNNELQQAEQRKTQETQKQAIERKQREHSLLMEKAPEFADEKKFKSAQDAVVNALKKEGFSDADLSRIASNELLDDHRIQLLLWKAARFDELQKAKTTIIQKPLPPAQRPGAGKVDTGPRAQIQALEKQLENATGMEAIRIGTRLTQLRRAG